MAGPGLSSRKRSSEDTESPTTGPASKRRQTIPKSPKTAIRDASEALIDVIRKVEEGYQKRPVPQPLKPSASVSAPTSMSVNGNTDANAKVVAKVPITHSHIYIVQEKTIWKESSLDDVSILGVYMALTDANNMVRTHCTYHAERDDPEAEFSEGRTEDGRIWWSWRDDTGYGFDVEIITDVVKPPGSEPVRDWGRDIGEPCPEPEDSESDSHSSGDESIASLGWVAPEDRDRVLGRGWSKPGWKPGNRGSSVEDSS